MKQSVNMRFLVSTIIAVLLSAGSTQASAQNITMFGGSSTAKECFLNSQTAATTGKASRTDIESCNKAIFHGELKKKDLVATYVNRGIIHMALAEHDQAARDYNKALSMSDDVGEAYVNRGNLWFVAGRLQEAVEDYNKSLEYGIERPYIALLNRGMAYEKLGELSLAKENYEAALEKVKGWPAAKQRLERVKQKIETENKNDGAAA